MVCWFVWSARWINLPQLRQQINESVAQGVTAKPHFRFEIGKIIKIRIKEDFLRSLFRCHHLKFSIWIFYVCKFVLIGYIISSYPHWNWIFSQKWLYYHWNWESHWWWVEITFRTLPSAVSPDVCFCTSLRIRRGVLLYSPSLQCTIDCVAWNSPLLAISLQRVRYETN